MDQTKNLTQKTFSGTLYLISSGGIQVVLKIGVLAVLARIISPKEFGLVGIALIIVEFSKLFAHMGVGPCIVQRKELEDRHLTTGFMISLITGLFFALLLVLAAPLMEMFFKMPGLTEVLRVIAIVFLVDSFIVIGQALLQRNMKFKLIALVEVASYAIGYGAIGILFGYLGYGVWALVIATLSQAMLCTFLIIILQPFPKALKFNKGAFREIIYYGGGFTIARIANFLATQGDNLVVGKTLGTTGLGIYGRAHQFMVMPSSLVGNALDRALFPAMAKVQDDRPRLVKAYLTGASLIAMASIPISVLFVFLAPEIVGILLGNAWLDVVLPFQILACSLVFRMGYKMSDSLARATNAVYRRAWRQMIYAGLIFGGSYIGHFWGLPGVAVGVAGSLMINFLMMAHLSKLITGFTWLDLFKAHSYGLLLGLVTTVVVFSLLSFCRQMDFSQAGTLLFTTIGSGLLLSAAIWLYPKLFIQGEHKELFFKLFLKRFKKPIVQAV